MNEKPPFSPRKALWKLICLLLGLILIAMLAATAAFRYLTDRVCPAAFLPEPAAASPKEAVLTYLDPGGVDWVRLSADLTKKERSTVNLLLLGQDRREEDTASRADSILLCSFRKSDGTLTLTSFLRDLYLPIPGHGKDRINAAYAYGGASLMKKTVTENFDIPVDGCVEVDFSQFSEIIDTLGGVELELRSDEAKVINRETGSALTEGLQNLSGDQALAYSRIRKLDTDGDFSRTDRQRKVVSAIVRGYRDADLPTLLKLLDQILPMLSTDMTQSRLLLLALDVFPMLSGMEIRSQSVPAPGTYTDEVINGMAVLSADMDAARELLREAAE